MNRLPFCAIFTALILAHALPLIAIEAPSARIERLPNSGVQAQVAVDDKGVVHLIYMSGDPSRTDIFYIRSTDGGQTFSDPLRVNSQPGSAISIGTVRGAHLALGKSGQIHVAWMGSTSAEPKGPQKSVPMLYARSTDDGKSFEPQRNVIQSHPGLDGGGSIAADHHGNVFIAWHAPTEKGAGEQSRHVWLSRSADDGKAFAPEQPISADTGACGCCGMKLMADDDAIYALYRTADQKIERDMTLLRLKPNASAATSDTVGKTQIATCVMSTSALAANPHGGAIGAWETSGQIFWSSFKSQGELAAPIQVRGRRNDRKHPAIAVNSAGQVLLAWAEGTAWNQGGSVAWLIYDVEGKPISGAARRGEGLPAWGAPAAFSAKDGSFVIVY